MPGAQNGVSITPNIDKNNKFDNTFYRNSDIKQSTGTGLATIDS